MKPLVLPESVKAGNFAAIDPLDSRYFDSQTARYLSERSRIACQAYVEAALAHTLADFKICSSTVAEQIELAASSVTAEAVYEAEKTTRHDIKALVNTIKEHVSDEAKPFVHFGATSYDVVSTAQALQLKMAITELVLPRLTTLLEALITLADTYADTKQIGRTHGQHGVPITFGFLMAEYVQRLGESMEALRDLSGSLYGKFSGAVGAYNALSIFVDDPLAFEKTLLKKVGLQPAPFSKQIVPAEYTVRLLDELAITANVMANLSHDMRNLQRTEIGEVRERFEKGQTGSSTMAHKRNPWNFENVISMSKQVSAQLINANMNIVSEHQRDLTDSASSRFYTLPLALVAAMAKRLQAIMAKLEVDESAMQRNLALTGGAIAAEPLYLLLEKYGHTAAHEVSKKISHDALAAGKTLYEAASTDASIHNLFMRFTSTEKQIIQYPETHYSGLAAKKARMISRKWQKKLQ